MIVFAIIVGLLLVAYLCAAFLAIGYAYGERDAKAQCAKYAAQDVMSAQNQGHAAGYAAGERKGRQDGYAKADAEWRDKLQCIAYTAETINPGSDTEERY